MVSCPGGRDTCDTIKPAIYADFAVDAVGTSYVDLSWSESADDSTQAASGKVPHFDVRWSSAAIATEGHWANANSWSGEPAPAGAGTFHAMTKTGLPSCTRYYVANRSPDDNQNTSLIHGSVTFKTLGTGCGSLMAEGGAGSSRLGEAGPRASEVAGLRSMSNGRIAGTGELESSGAGTGPLVIESAAGPAGGWTVTASRVGGVAGVPADAADAIVVQAPDGKGGWRTINRLRPPAGEDLVGLCALRDGGRFVLPASYSVEQVGTNVGNGGGSLAETAATHSADGDLNRTALADPNATDLKIGESLTTTYADAVGDGTTAESWHLLVRRHAVTSGLFQDGAGSEAMLPTSFGLRQNVPNPFAAATSIEFQLPRASHVRIEIFDLFGRRVRTLTDASWPAGNHAVTWDRTSERGTRLSSGVFLYRMTAEGFTEHKRMVLVGGD